MLAGDHDSVSVSPLAAIRGKERALSQEIQAAQERAQALMAQARTRAAAIKDQAEREGMREAETLLQEELARAQREAEAIQGAGQVNAADLGAAGRARLAKAVESIVSFVLPR